MAVLAALLVLVLGHGSLTADAAHNWWLAVLVFLWLSFSRGLVHRRVTQTMRDQSPVEPPRGARIGLGIIGGILLAATLALTIYPFVAPDLRAPVIIFGLLGGLVFLALATGRTNWIT